MKRFIERLQTILRIVLSQLGFSGAETPDPVSSPKNDSEEVKELLPTTFSSTGSVAAPDGETEFAHHPTPSSSAISVAVVDAQAAATVLLRGDERERRSSQTEKSGSERVVEKNLPVVTIDSRDEDRTESSTEDLASSGSQVPIDDGSSLIPIKDNADDDTSQRGISLNVGSTSNRDLVAPHEKEVTNSQQPTGVFLSNQKETVAAADRTTYELPSTNLGVTKIPASDRSESYRTGPVPRDEAESSIVFSSIDAEASTKGDESESEFASGAPRELQQFFDSPVPRIKADSRSSLPSKPLTPRQPAPTEEAREYSLEVCDIAIVDREYARWNRAVVEQVLLSRRNDEGVYLCITPRILASAFAEAGFDILAPDEAEARFTAAVANVYVERVLRNSDHLRVLRRRGDDGLPDCVAFLAASVLAAYHMQSDEDAGANAYYRRFGDLLNCEMAGAHPSGFSPIVFESLWVFVSNWLDENHHQRLVMPRSDVGLRRFVALPLAHVPLRRLDIEKLPSFFGAAAYEPQSRIDRDQLYEDLRLWQQTTNALTQTGAQALSDDRSNAVLAQVIAELESWDGSFSESTTRRTALVEIQFDIVQRQPILAYLARRPFGFPSVFDGGERLLEASAEGWYDPSPIGPTDGQQLVDGFEWQSSGEGLQFTLRRSPTGVVALAPSSSYSGFLSSRYLPRGIRCAVLCRNDLIDSATEYLSEVARQSLNAVPHPMLPTGWSIIRDIIARTPIEAPVSLRPIQVDPNIGLLVSGGLRIGHQWSWLAGAAPQILVTGIEEGDTARINGLPFEVNENGELMCSEAIAKPGEYFIEAGSARRRVEIVEPKVSSRASNHRQNTIDGKTAFAVALPGGSWTVVGACPGEVCNGRAFLRATLASCSFQPVWAIQVGGGPGAKVAVLTTPEPPSHVNPRTLTHVNREDARRWANAISNANRRRRQFIGLNGIIPDQRSEIVWKQYAFAAKQIKRGLKRV
jgi:hypothetical protein